MFSPSVGIFMLVAPTAALTLLVLMVMGTAPIGHRYGWRWLELVEGEVDEAELAELALLLLAVVAVDDEDRCADVDE